MISAAFLSRNTYDPVNPDNLWCLRILLATRWKKRFDQCEGDGPVGGLDKVDIRLGHGRVATAISSASQQREVAKFKDITVSQPIKGPLQKDPITGLLGATKTVVNVIKSVPDGTEMRGLDMGTMHDAGYALVWYLRNDAVT
ncbi:hypothetical protein WKW79_34910 [Variovorax robiniae]|uniref:Uncharacterized protein n=1 Tax=Variovorax robiniae TaxID=1836199 RepID=A0ABU8XL85_9BURK